MYCGQCGRKVDDNAKFCDYCGATLSEEYIADAKEFDNHRESKRDNNVHSIDDAFAETEIIDKEYNFAGIEIKQYGNSIIPVIFSVIFFLLLVVFVFLLVRNYMKLDLANINLANNQALQEDIHNISSQVDENLTAHQEIILRLYDLTESYNLDDVSEVDTMISDLTSLETLLKSEYDEIGELYGEEYELFWCAEDYTVEDRNEAIQNWKKSRQIKVEYSDSDDDSYKSAEERALDDTDNDINQFVVKEEANINLKLALKFCHLNEYYFNDEIDTTVNRAQNEIDENRVKILTVWTIIIAIIVILTISVIKIFTLNRRKHYRER